MSSSRYVVSSHPSGPRPSFTQPSGIVSVGTGPSVGLTFRNATANAATLRPCALIHGLARRHDLDLKGHAKYRQLGSVEHLPLNASMSWKLSLLSTASPLNVDMVRPIGLASPPFSFSLHPPRPPPPPLPSEDDPSSSSSSFRFLATLPLLPLTSVSAEPMAPSSSARWLPRPPRRRPCRGATTCR